MGISSSKTCVLVVPPSSEDPSIETAKLQSAGKEKEGSKETESEVTSVEKPLNGAKENGEQHQVEGTEAGINDNVPKKDKTEAKRKRKRKKDEVDDVVEAVKKQKKDEEKQVPEKSQIKRNSIQNFFIRIPSEDIKDSKIEGKKDG